MDEAPTQNLETQTVVLSEDDFRPQLRERISVLLAQHSAFEGDPRAGKLGGRRKFRNLEEQAEEVETFLDDHDARWNQSFAPITECVASMRGFAKLGLLLTQVVARLGSEYPSAAEGSGPDFLVETENTLAFVGDSLRSLMNELVAVCQQEGVASERLPHRRATNRSEQRIIRSLPRNIDEQSSPDERRVIAELGAKFLAHKAILDRQSDGKRFEDPDEMRRFVLEVSDEEQCRFFETRIHSLLSRYDTYVQGTQLESADETLRRFRALIGLTRKILSSMVQLVHFYERHENDIRCESTKNRIAELVDKETVLDRILNYALCFLHRFMEEAAPFADEMVKTYTQQSTIQCEISGDLTLHVRPASLIVKIVTHHGIPVTMRIGDEECYAGSVLQVLTAIGRHPEVRTVQFEGDRAVLEDLRMLFESGLGEKGPLPPSLEYLGVS